MVTYEQKKQSTLRLFRTVISFAQRLKLPEYVQLLQETAQNLDDGRFMVVVCGEFRRGKSSLLNAFLNELQDIFPVDIAITTNLVTTITYGANEQITALVGLPDSEDLKKISINRNEIRLYVTEKDNPHNQREAQLLEISLPNPQLKQGLILVDTPGVGGLYARHTDVTYSFIPSADAIIYVSDAFQPLSEEDLRFIKDRILKHTDHIIFVLTKKDRVEAYQKVIESNREKLAATLGRSADTITIIPVSSSIKRTYLKTHDPEDLEDSNFQHLEAALWQFVNAGRGRILLARALTTLAQTVGNMRRPFQVEYDAYQEQNKQKLDEIQASLQEASTILQQLQNDNAQWQTQLQDGLEDIHRDVQHQFDRGFAEIRRLARSYITEAVLQSPELVLGPVQRDINDLLYKLQRIIDEKTSRLQGDIEHRTGLSLNPFETQALYARAAPLSGTFTKREITTWESTVDVASSSSGQSGGGGFWSGVGKFFSNMGRAIGRFFTGQSGSNSSSARRTMREIRKPDRQHIENQLMSIVSDNEREQRNTLSNSMQQIGRSIRNDLLEKIKREHESRERALKSFQEARTLTTTQANARIALLKGPLQQFDTIQKNIQDLMQETISQDDDPPNVRKNQKGDANSAKAERQAKAENEGESNV